MYHLMAVGQTSFFILLFSLISICFMLIVASHQNTTLRTRTSFKHCLVCLTIEIHLFFIRCTWCCDVSCVISAGFGFGIYQEANGLHLYQERVKLAGWPHARKQEEETWGCHRGAVAQKGGKTHFLITVFLLVSSIFAFMNFFHPSGGRAKCRGRRWWSCANAVRRVQVSYFTWIVLCVFKL